MWPISSERGRSLMKRWFGRLDPCRTFKCRKGPQVNHAPTDLKKAQEALQRAQAERAEVFKMRPRTRQIARRAEELLNENHLAERIRRSWMA